MARARTQQQPGRVREHVGICASVPNKRGRRTNLLVLEPEQENLLHQRQLWLLAALCALADVSRVECDLVAVFVALVARLRGIVEVARGVVSLDATIAALALGSSAAAAAPASGQSRRR